MTLYLAKPVEGEPFKIELSETEWFKVFLKGAVRGQALEWIERADSPEKHVTFEENQSGTTLS